MELVLTLPILMFLLFGLFEFSVLLHARSALAPRRGHALLPHVGRKHVEVQVVVARNERGFDHGGTPGELLSLLIV